MSDELLNRLILFLNDTYGSYWNRDLEYHDIQLWKDISAWQWESWPSHK